MRPGWARFEDVGVLGQLVDRRAHHGARLPLVTGSPPVSVAFSPRGRVLGTANPGSGTVSVFSVDPSTGTLTPVPVVAVRGGRTTAQISYAVTTNAAEIEAILRRAVTHTAR